MFRRAGARSAVHPDGYEVRELLPRFVEYREADHVLRFGGELTGRKSPYDIILYVPAPPCWEPPFENGTVPPESMPAIIERVTAGLEALGIRPLWG